MVHVNINDIFKKTSSTVKKIKEKVDSLKKDQEDSYDKSIEEPAKPRAHKIDQIEITFSMIGVAKATLVVMGLFILMKFFAQISEIILIFFVSLLFAAAIDPTVDALEKKKVPRSLSVIGIFLILIILLVFFISQLIPLVATQLFDLAISLTAFLNKIAANGVSDLPFGETMQPLVDDFLKQVDKEVVIDQIKNYIQGLGEQLQTFAGDTVGVIIAVFNGIFNFILVLIMTFFLTVDEKGVNNFLVSLFPSKHAKYILTKSEAIKHKIGYWLRGQIVLMFVMFCLSLIGLLIIGVDYALTLAMMVGIAELIPVVGPILAGIPAVLVGLNESPWIAVWILALYIFIQQLEGNVVVPIVMKKAVGLNPIIIILSMLIGYNTLGILGMIIAIPVTTALSIFVRDYTVKEK
jgi:predicted PurR-regulated permease PerM